MATENTLYNTNSNIHSGYYSKLTTRQLETAYLHPVLSLSLCTYMYIYMGIAVAQWLGCCATKRKVAGSIPAGVNGFITDIKSFRSHYGPGVDSASNRK